MSKLTKHFASKLLFSCLVLYFAQKYINIQWYLTMHNGTRLIHSGTRHFAILMFSSGPESTVGMSTKMHEVKILFKVALCLLMLLKKLACQKFVVVWHGFLYFRIK